MAEIETVRDVGETMQQTIERAINIREWALVGANNNPHKYGYIIFNVMRRSGYTMYPVNTTEPTVENEPAYPDLSSLPIVPQVVNFVVPPYSAMRTLEEAARLGVDIVWFQPGAESAQLIARAHELGLHPIYDACAMVLRKRWPDGA